MPKADSLNVSQYADLIYQNKVSESKIIMKSTGRRQAIVEHPYGVIVSNGTSITL
jgi:hypothetical protein